MDREPKHYNLPDHLQRIYDSPEFAKAAKEAERTTDQFRHDVELALKDLTKEVRDNELRDFERTLGSQALNAALEKFKSDVAFELKSVVSKARAAEARTRLRPKRSRRQRPAKPPNPMRAFFAWLRSLWRSRKAFHYCNDDDQPKRTTWVG